MYLLENADLRCRDNNLITIYKVTDSKIREVFNFIIDLTTAFNPWGMETRKWSEFGYFTESIPPSISNPTKPI